MRVRTLGRRSPSSGTGSRRRHPEQHLFAALPAGHLPEACCYLPRSSSPRVCLDASSSRGVSRGYVAPKVSPCNRPTRRDVAIIRVSIITSALRGSLITHGRRACQEKAPCEPASRRKSNTYGLSAVEFRPRAAVTPRALLSLCVWKGQVLCSFCACIPFVRDLHLT